MCEDMYAWSTQNCHDPVSEVLELVMKSNEKELNVEQVFSPEERKLWHERGLKEWEQWIKMYSHPTSVARTAGSEIVNLSAPMRYVRTVKKRNGDNVLSAQEPVAHSWALGSTVWSIQD